MNPVPSNDCSGVDFAALFDALPQPALVLRPDLTIVAASDGFLRDIRAERAAVVGRRLGEGAPEHPALADGGLAAIRGAVDAAAGATETPAQDLPLGPAPQPPCADTARRSWNLQVVPSRDAADSTPCLLLVFDAAVAPARADAAAEDRFRDAEARFEATFEQSAVGIAHIAPDGRFLQINQRFCDLLGQSRAEMLARSIHDITHPDDIPASVAQATALLSGSIPHYTIEKRYRRRDGTFLWAGASRSLVRTPSGAPAYFVAVVEDISARKAAEATLQERETHMRAILDTVPDGMIVIDRDGTIESFSRTAEVLFGYQAAEVVGRNVRLLMPAGDRERHDDYIHSYLDTGKARIIGLGRIVVGQRRDGSTFSLNLIVGEMRVGDDRRFVGFVRDLTERQAADKRLRELQAELVHISRFTALGEMASALAHELNQPLTAITNYLKGCRRLLDQGLEDRAPMLSEAIGQAAEQALRAGQIIRRLRDFVARGESQHSSENLPRLIEEASVLALVGAREGGVGVSFVFDPAAPAVYADRIQIQQVLMNLIRNAIEAMQEAPRRELDVATAARPEGMVEISVADSGTGLAPEVAARLFQPFVTTKMTGMGVGLSICRTIVEAHDGKISAAPNRGGGTTFRFTLRAARSEDPAHAE